MRQLLLDLSADQAPGFDTFVVGANAEVTQRLQQLADRPVPIANRSANDHFIYLWGEAGAGKSHLLRALAAAANGRYIAADAPTEAFDYTPGTTLYVIDDCEQLPAASQIDAFNLFNQIREQGGSLVTAGTDAPAQLDLREDLRTRLGWGLIYRIHGLTDEEKVDALTQAAVARGMILSPGVLPYLITHFRRDMRSLSAMLYALDNYSLETQRPITLPLLRSLLQLDGQEPPL